MGFERRGNGTYYYKKEREGDKVVSRYVGSGEMAFLMSQWDQIKAYEEEEKRLEKKREREMADRFDSELNEFEKTMENLVAAYLLTNGYHQTSSREWRKKRNGKR
jgi:FMN-dependent NADH-azoreductase